MSIHLKLLVDVGVGKAVEKWLKAQGYDVLAIRDFNPRMPDLDMLFSASFRSIREGSCGFGHKARQSNELGACFELLAHVPFRHDIRQTGRFGG